jgi:hypothetical protein
MLPGAADLTLSRPTVFLFWKRPPDNSAALHISTINEMAEFLGPKPAVIKSAMLNLAQTEALP